MNIFKQAMYHKCLQIIIMFLPVFIWNIVFLLEVCFGYEFQIFRVFNILLMIVLVCFILLIDSVLIIVFKNNSLSNIEFLIHKPTMILLVKSIFVHIPFVFIILFCSINVLIAYGVIEFMYVLIDKKHNSIMERIYFIALKIYIDLTRKTSDKSKDSKLISGI